MENIHSSFTKLSVLEVTTFKFIVRNTSLDIIQRSPTCLLRIITLIDLHVCTLVLEMTAMIP